jgi:tRNA (cmo5U34)-methyltransferase
MMETQPRPREDWTDDEYVRFWIAREQSRGDVRNRQFQVLRAFVPKKSDEAFRYLDIGCGDGRLDEVLLARFTRATAVLLDGSAVMLDTAKERLSRFADRIETVQVDLSTPEWTKAVPGPINLAVSTIAIHNLRDPRRIRELYGETHGLLEEGSVFINLDYVRPPSPAFRDLSVWAVGDPEVGALASSTGGGSGGTADEQLIWLRDAGFAPVDCPWKECQASLLVGFKGRVAVPSR